MEKFNFRDFQTIYKYDKQYEFLNKLSIEDFNLFTIWIKQLLNDNNPSPLYLNRHGDGGRFITPGYYNYIFKFYYNKNNKNINKTFQNNIEKALINLIQNYDPNSDNNDYFGILLYLIGELEIKYAKDGLIKVGNELRDVLITKDGDGENLLERLARVLWGFGFTDDIDSFMDTIKEKYSKLNSGINEIVDAYKKDKKGEKWY